LCSLRNRSDKKPFEFNLDKILPLLKEDKFNFMETPESPCSKNTENSWDNKTHCVTGTFILHKDYVHKFSEMFYKYLDECRKNTNSYVCRTDQHIYTKMYRDNPDNFNKLCTGYACVVKL
jgi:hypothetical protein